MPLNNEIMITWLREHVDVVALFFSIIAIIVSVVIYFAERHRENDFIALQQDIENTLRASEICNNFLRGEGLNREVLQSSDFEAIINGKKPFDTLTSTQNRALGDEFNLLELSAMEWQEGTVNKTSIRKCLSEEYFDYCRMIVAKNAPFITEWVSLNKVVFSSEFWENDIPEECQEAQKIEAKRTDEPDKAQTTK